MLTALWPATLGYFLSQMMAERLHASADRDRAPVRARQCDSARRPACIQRRQDSLRRAAGHFAAPLSRQARSNLAGYARAQAGAVRLASSGRTGSTSSGSGAAHAEHWRSRRRTGRPARHGRQLHDASAGARCWATTSCGTTHSSTASRPQSFNTWWTTHLAAGRKLLDDFGFNAWDPRVIHLGMENTSFPVPFPTVQDGRAVRDRSAESRCRPGRRRKRAITFSGCKQAAVADIQAENYPGPEADLAAVQDSAPVDDSRLRRPGAEQPRSPPARLQISQIARSRRSSRVQPPRRRRATADYLGGPGAAFDSQSRRSPGPTFCVSFDPPPESPFARLAELRASLDRLAALPTAELDRLLTETLDACSHRLDVWASAIANALLQRQRSAQVSGTSSGRLRLGGRSASFGTACSDRRRRAAERVARWTRAARSD